MCLILLILHMHGMSQIRALTARFRGNTRTHSYLSVSMHWLHVVHSLAEGKAGWVSSSPAIPQWSLCHTQVQSIAVSLHNANSTVYITRIFVGYLSGVCNFVLSAF